MRYLRFRAWLDFVATDIAQPAAIFLKKCVGTRYGRRICTAAFSPVRLGNAEPASIIGAVIDLAAAVGRLRSGDGGGPHMTGEEKRHSAARLVADRRESLWRSGSFDGGDRDALVNLARPAGHGRPGGALPDRSEARKAGSRGWRKRSAGCAGSNGTTSSSSGHDRNARLGKQSAAGLG